MFVLFISETECPIECVKKCIGWIGLISGFQQCYSYIPVCGSAVANFGGF